MNLADHNNGLILTFAIGQKEHYQDSFVHEFLSFLDRVKILPKKMMASDEEFINLFQPMTDKLGIDLVETNDLNVIEDMQKNMNDFF